MTQHILRIDSSARRDGSASRAFAAAALARLPAAHVTTRDLADGVPLLDAGYVTGTFTPDDARTDAQRTALAPSDTLLAEVQAADTLLISLATYNFNVPASLKAWIDQIARAGLAFRYTETGPEGLLTGKRAVIVRASGGSPTGADNDFATPYLRYILGFVGISDVSFFDAPAEADAAQIDAVVAALAPAKTPAKTIAA